MAHHLQICARKAHTKGEDCLMIRLSVFVIAILATSIVGTSAAPKEQPPLLMEHTSLVRIGHPESPFNAKTSIQFVDRLQINEVTSHRTAVRQDEQAGIKNLRGLCLNASVEEHWVFLPDEDLWLEISYDEAPGSAEIDLDFLEDLIKKHENLAIYHIHLRSYLKSLKERGYSAINETWLAIPSFEDIALMVYFTSHFHTYHPEGKISWKICSPLGLTEYSLTDEGIAHYDRINNDTFLLSYLYPSRSKAMDPEAVSTFDITAPHKVDDLINWANEQGKDYIEVKFFPHAKKK